ncbi:MAG: DUF3363 domain-containing protein [Alphaproteobacteria bacterium]
MIRSGVNFKAVWKDEEENFRPSLRAGRDSKVVMGAATRSLHMKLNRSVELRDQKNPKRVIQKPDFKRGNVFDYSRGYAQRVVVKAHVVKHVGKARNARTLRSHAYYLTREGAGAEGERASFYSSEGEELEARRFVEAAKADPHHFRIIISPENASEIEDMTSYVRDVMEKIDEDLGAQTDWMAVNHFNTDNPHSHVIIRGRDKSGKELRISRDYISHGMRARAQEMATLYLGERSLSEVREARKGEMCAQRVTSLDYKIEELAGENRIIDARLGRRLGRNLFEESLVRGRLIHLRAMGLAEERGISIFEVKEDFKTTLSELSRRGDIIKQMYERIGKESAQMVYVDLRKSEGQSVVGMVMDKGPVDELKDRYYVVIKDRMGKPHYINIGSNRNYEDIRKGAIVKVGVAQASTGKADLNIAQIAQQNDGVYNLYKHYQHVEEHMAFIPEEDRQIYVDRHMVRLETFEKSGVVERLNEIEFKVPKDIVEQGEKITEEINDKLRRYGVADVKFVSEMPVDRQVGAQAWTDLDETLLMRSQGKISELSGWREIEAALEKRVTYLKENGYAKEVNGKLQISSASKPVLQQKELKTAAVKLEARFNRSYQPIESMKNLNGIYRGRVKLHSGDHAVISYGRQGLTMVPVQSRLTANVGQEVNIQLTKKGLYRIRARELGLKL